jgi:predicted nucleic acid-binding protein
LEFAWKYPYDAIYLAIGELLDCPVWTADEHFFADAHATYPRLQLLSGFTPP